MQNMPMFFLVAVAIGGVAWVFLYPVLSGEKRAEKRQQSVVRADPAAPAARTARNQQKPRREQIEATLKQVEPPRQIRLAQRAHRTSRPCVVEAAFFYHVCRLGGDRPSDRLFARRWTAHRAGAWLRRRLRPACFGC